MSDTSEMIPLDTAEQIGDLIDLWHSGQVATLKHLQKIPDGSKFTVGTEEITLSGDTLKGFKAGIETSLMLLGKLPIEFIEDDVETAGA